MLYKITLKPVGSFYFGGEESFGEGKSKGNNDEDISKNYFSKRSAYFAKGEKFPQQTQVLGMLRKEIMRKQNCLKIHNNGECIVKGKKTLAVDLVGMNWKENLGKIKRLTPLFLEKGSELFVPAPFDEKLTLSQKEGVSYINGRKDISYVYGFMKSNDEMFNAKDSLCRDYVSDKSIIVLDDIFTSVTRIGNQTLGYTEDDEEQLYKIRTYTLDAKFNFVCYMEITEDLLEVNDGYKNIVELGGERSSFKLEVTIVDKEVSSEVPFSTRTKDESRIVLTSDTYVGADIFEHVKVALADKVSFRTINSNKAGFSKSSKTVLLGKGSVFFPSDNKVNKIIDLIENEEEYRIIGYNQYIKLDKQKG